MLPKIVSLVSMVLLILWMFYFAVGSLPLLILKHSIASDSRMVRGFFDVHYRVLFVIGNVGAVSAAASGRLLLAATIAGIVLIGFVARRLIVPRMDALRPQMTASDAPAVQRFRRLHVAGVVLDVVLLAAFVLSLRFSSADIVTCINVPPGCSGEACRVQCSLL